MLGRAVFPIISAAAVYDPAVLSLSGWWRASFPGSPWTPTASAGSSGSNGNLITSGVVPGSGTAVNGYTPANFNGSTKALTPGTATTSTLMSVSALTIVVLANAAASVAAASNFYDDPAFYTEGNGNGALVFTSSGVRAGIYSGGSSGQTTSIAQATGSWFLAAMRYDNTNIKCRVNSTDCTPVAKGAAAAFANASYVGKNYAAAKWFQGDILEIMTASTVLADADLTNIKSYFNSRYALAL